MLLNFGELAVNLYIQNVFISLQHACCCVDLILYPETLDKRTHLEYAFGNDKRR